MRRTCRRGADLPKGAHTFAMSASGEYFACLLPKASLTKNDRPSRGERAARRPRGASLAALCCLQDSTIHCGAMIHLEKGGRCAFKRPHRHREPPVALGAGVLSGQGGSEHLERPAPGRHDEVRDLDAPSIEPLVGRVLRGKGRASTDRTLSTNGCPS